MRTDTRLTNQHIRIAMNTRVDRLVTAKLYARQYHKAKAYKAWSLYMRECKKLKREIAMLANILHRRLYAEGITKVQVHWSGNYTYKDILTLCRSIFLLPQAG